MGSSQDFQNADTDYGPLTQRQAENIADLCARRAQERLYAEIGKGVVRKTVYLLGAGAAFLITWLSGWFHFGPK